MNGIKNYYERFRMANPKNTELKLLMLILFLGVLFFRGIGSIELSWDLPISLIVFLFSMTCHEVAHGYAAHRFGDDTAKKAGRLTLNPLKHLDITGLILPLLILFSGSKFLIGWAKPVPVNFYRLKPERLGLFCVAIAGIAVNMSFVLISLIFIRIFGNGLNPNGIVMSFLLYVYLINLVLAFFNLIPVTPLDGGRIIYSMANKKVRAFYDRIEKYGMIIVIIIVYTGLFSNFFSYILDFFISLLKMDINVILS